MTEGFAATAPAVAHVFVEDVASDADLWVDGDDGHHLQRVRRLRAGEAVTASDGSGHWRQCTVAEVGDGRLRLTPAGPLTTEPALTPRLVIAFAPAKGDQAGAVVAQLVELGVDAVMPITVRRSVVRWDGARGEKARIRLGRVMREAAMQSRRARLPELLAARSLSELAAASGARRGGPARRSRRRGARAVGGGVAGGGGSRGWSRPHRTGPAGLRAAPGRRSARITGSDGPGRGGGRFGRVSPESGARLVRLWADRPMKPCALGARMSTSDVNSEIVCAGRAANYLGGSGVSCMA